MQMFCAFCAFVLHYLGKTFTCTSCWAVLQICLFLFTCNQKTQDEGERWRGVKQALRHATHLACKGAISVRMQDSWRFAQGLQRRGSQCVANPF